MGIVNFEFRPEELQHVILERHVDRKRLAHASGIAERESLADGALHIKVAPAFASGDGGS